jgi:1-phosphofructokinase family hexose kinase
MYLTVTANSALDRVFFIDRFVPGTVMRPERVVEAVGGKGFDASVALRALGLETTALGFVAGETGRALVNLLEDYGIQHDLVWVEGETRVAHVIVETALQRHSHIIAAGYSVTDEACDELLGKLSRRLPGSRWLILAGSLPEGAPADFYRKAVTAAQRSGVPALVDCPGAPALQALPAGPAVMKMNHQELSQTFGVESGSMRALGEEAAEIRRQNGLLALVVTCGEEGVLASLPEATYLAAAPRQEVVNAAGAGDAVSAALAWRLSLGDAWPEALRWGAAVGAATVLTARTAECRREDVERIYLQVEVFKL